MQKDLKNFSFPKKVLYIVVELVILIVAFYILNFITYLAINLPSFISSDSLLSTLALILGFPLLLILTIYIFNFLGYNFSLNSKTGKTFLKIIIGFLILDIVIHVIGDIIEVQYYSELASSPIEEVHKILGDKAFANYSIKLLSGKIISWQDIIIYLIWQISGLIAFSKGAFGAYTEENK